MKHRKSPVPATTPFSHLKPGGALRMVNVGGKAVQQRRARAVGRLVCQPATIEALRAHALPKGDVLAVARVAAVQGVKRTAELIPLCHPLPVEHIEIDFEVRDHGIELVCTVATSAKTGVEMEALTGVTVAALTLYDMCKAVDGTMRIENIHLTEKLKL